MHSTHLIAKLETKIHWIRDARVMLANDLASLYGVEVRALVQAVKRNIDRFPADFMFQITEEESENLKSQFVISSSGWGGSRRSLPYAFTEQGVAMLSSVLNSERAVRVNIMIMRAFVRLREQLRSEGQLAENLQKLHRQILKHDRRFKKQDSKINQLFEEVWRLMQKEKNPIGFRR